MASDSTHLTIAEASQQFDVSTQTVRRWVKSGRLKAIRLPSGRARIPREDVEAIMRGDVPEAVAS